MCRRQTDIRPSGHQERELTHHSLWEPRDAKGAAGALGEQRPSQSPGGWMSVMETQAAAHRQRGQDGGDLPKQFRLMSSPHKSCRINRELTREKGYEGASE